MFSLKHVSHHQKQNQEDYCGHISITDQLKPNQTKINDPPQPNLF